MKPPDKLSEKRIASWLVAALALIAVAALLLPHLLALDPAQHPPLYTAMETFSIVVAMLAFAVGIKIYRKESLSEQSLRESEGRLKRILEGSSDGFWDCDLATGAVEYSGRWAEMLGYPPEEIAPQRDAWEALIHPDDRERVLKSRADYLAGWSSRYDVEFRMRAKPGEWRWIRSRGQITQRDAEGKPLRISGAHTDITEQKSAAENLALLKRQNDLILNATGEGICGVDAHGIIVFANPAAARMLGFTVDELFGQSLHAISHHTRPDGSPYPAADCPILSTLHDGVACHEGDELYWRRDGASFPVEYTSTPIVDEGETIGAVVMFSDITLRRQAEETLQESEDLFRTLFNGITDAIFVLPVADDGVPGHFVVVNNVACEWLGYTHREMLALSPLDVDAPDTGIDITPIVKRLAAGESVTFEQILVAKDGRRIPVELRANPLLLRGERAVMTLARDISERKQAENALRESEERYRGTFEQAAVGIAHTALDGHFLKLNQKFCEITGYSREELLRLSFRDITFPADLARDLGHVRQALTGEIATFAMEKRYVRKDRTLVWVSLTVSLLRKADGSPHYFVGVIEDITERKRTEQQLHELTAHLQTVREEEKASIAREIHDDLGGTLTALKMEAHWLARKLPAEKEMLPLLEHVESMSGLLDSAVTATRRIITELRPTILDDLGLLAALEWQCGQFHKRTGIECRVVGSEAENLELNKARSINLFRIFQEALTNVSRHSEATRVDVEFHHGDEEITLSIRDNGRGLPEDRAVASTSYGMRGMFERVEQLGGKLKFDSPPGGGLSVTVRLPLVGCGEARTASIANDAVPSSPHPTHTKEEKA